MQEIPRSWREGDGLRSRALGLAEVALEEARSARETMIARTLGKSIEELAGDSELINIFFDDPDERVRANCIAYLSCFYLHGRNYIDVMKRYAVADPSPSVRATAVAGIGEVGRRLKDTQTLIFLYSVLMNSDEVEHIRKAAYLHLVLNGFVECGAELSDPLSFLRTGSLEQCADWGEIALMVHRLGGTQGE